MNSSNTWFESIRQIYRTAALFWDVRPEEAMTIVKSSSLGAFLSFLNAFLIVIFLWSPVNAAFLTAWLSLSTIVNIYIAYRSRTASGHQLTRVSGRAVRRMVLFAFLFALPWLVLTIAFLGAGIELDNLLILLVCAGMSAGGGLMLYRVPLAAFAYSGSILLVAAGTAAFKSFDTLWPVIIYSFTYGIVVARLIITSWQIARDREDSLTQTSEANRGLQQANLEIRRLALRDSLTELANRDAFIETLSERISNATNDRFAVLLLDLDRFKNINDSIGHGAGDELLCVITNRLRNALRKTDFIARFGGDEFALILDMNSGADTVLHVARRLLEKLNAPVSLRRALIHPNASIGIALYPEHADTPQEFIRLADIAMHRAKDAGRGRCELYSAEMAVAIERMDTLEKKIREAIEHEQMALYYQPKIRIGTGEIVGAEALLRWFDADGRQASTIELLEIAEERGLIPQISNFVFEQVTRDVVGWKAMKLTTVPISVNIHSYDLKTPELLMVRLKNMIAAGIEPSEVVLEVTEGCFVGRGSDEATMTLDTIHDMGFKLSLDDFGTGHAALSHLKHLKVGELKVDREFINGICEDKRDQAITLAALEITHCLGIDCVAEGIETREQADFLLGIDSEGRIIGQGYLWAKPMDASEWRIFCREYPEQNCKTGPRSLAM